MRMKRTTKMLEIFLITILAGYIATVAGNVTSDKIHDYNQKQEQVDK